MTWDRKAINQPLTTAKKFPLFYHILFYGLFKDAVSSLWHTALDCDLRFLYDVILPLRQRLGPQTLFFIVCYTVRFLDTSLHVLHGLLFISLWFQGKEWQYSEISHCHFFSVPKLSSQSCRSFSSLFPAEFVPPLRIRFFRDVRLCRWVIDSWKFRWAILSSSSRV